jgi:hypothetical protein
MAWLSGLKIKKNILLEQQPLSCDDAELAAMRRMVMDDALKRKSMAQRVGITAYIKNRPQVDASVVKNVVANVSSFNRYRSEKDYEEWVIRERERAARLKTSRSQDVGERSTAQSSGSDEESSVGSRAQQPTGAHGPSDEESALRRQVKERLRRARADEREPAPGVDGGSKSQERAVDGDASNSECDGCRAAAGGEDLPLREHGARSLTHDKHRDRSRERHRHGGDKHRDRSRERHRDDGNKHRDRSRERHRDDGDKHRDRSRERHRDDGDKHRDRSRERHRDDGDKHRDRSRERHRDDGDKRRDRSRERHRDDGDKRRDRSRERHRHGGDGGAERRDEAKGGERTKDREAHRQRSDHDCDGGTDGDKREMRKESHRQRRDRHDTRRREEQEHSGDKHGNR